MSRITTADLLGLAILVPALAFATSWLLQDARLFALIPGAAMVLNTALCFVLTALAMRTDSLAPRARRLSQSALGGLIALTGAVSLSQPVLGLDLGIDWPNLHDWNPDSGPYPGRMSPPTAIAFVLGGLSISLMHRVRGIWEGLILQAATAAVIVIGCAGITGYLLKLHLVYRDYLFGQMELSAAAGLILWGTGLWLCWRKHAWYTERRLFSRKEQRITLIGTVVLASIVSASVLVGVVLMAQDAEALTRDGLSKVLVNRVNLFKINVELRSARAELIATRPNLIEQVDRLNTEPGNVLALSRLANAVESFLPYGFSGLEFYDARGRRILRAGEFVDENAYEVKLRADSGLSMTWSNGFVLRAELPLRHRGSVIGTVIVEQQLPLLTNAIQSEEEHSNTGETAICGHDLMSFTCFPQRFVPEPFTLPFSADSPMGHALAGKTGLIDARDYRRENVIAAYAPIGSLGLGMVVKMDTAELYAPLRENLYTVLALMLLMLTAGAWFLHRNVTPLARGLAQSEERLQLAMAASQIALWDMDLPSGMVHLSEQWEAILGGTPKVTNSRIEDLHSMVHPEDIEDMNKSFRAALSRGNAEYLTEHRVKIRNGQWKWIRSHGRVVERHRNGRALRMTGTNVDISASKESELQLFHKANHDALTGLPNRSLFADRLGQILARARRSGALMAVMYLDIDKFKGVNDTQGHEAGDLLLKEFATRLAGCIRATDTAARLGGDEFAVILDALDNHESGCRIAEKIVLAMRTPFTVGKDDAQISTSLGLVFHSGDGEIDAENLLRKADAALYAAKGAGRDNYKVADE